MDGLKNKITDYWSQRAETFAAQRVREFESEKHDLWLREFQQYIPRDQRLQILDVGTGTGFFALLLAAAGQQVTGIDLTENMIGEAKKISAKMGIQADFYVMDAEAPQFAPGTFDIIVSRNLTWTLPHLDTAYRSWHDLLKPGGLLINFDADYCHEKKAENLPENHAHKLISPRLMGEYEEIKKELKETQRIRPYWDQELLTRAGFRDVKMDTGVWKRIYRDVDEFYNPTPIFKIVAYA